MPNEQLTIREPNGKPLIEMKDRPLTPMALLQLALENKAAIDVIERLAALQERAVAMEAELEFNASFGSVQSEVRTVVCDGKMDNGHRWASYEAMDKELRPIYLKHGITLSFDSEDGREPESVRAICYVTKGAHTRRYTSPSFASDGKGAKGGGVMNSDQATSSALSYAKRRLIEFIFNIVTEDDGPGLDTKELRERIAHFEKCQTLKEVDEHFKASWIELEERGNAKDKVSLVAARDNRRNAIRGGARQ